MEEFYDIENNNKKNHLKAFILLFILGLICGALYYYKKTSAISLKTVNIEVGSELSTNINDYIKSGNKIIDNYKLDLSKVDTSKVGKYKYSIKYNKHIVYSYVNVRDTKSPVVTLDDTIIVGTSYDFDPNIFILKCEDYSLPCQASINDNDLKKLSVVGNYDINVTVYDKYNNKTSKKVNINVIDGDTISSIATNDLDYYSNSENDQTLSHDLFMRFDSAIIEDSAIFSDTMLEISTTDFSEYESDIYSSKIISAYNKYGYVIGFQVEITKNDGTKVLLKK